ncbi:MAG: hypothetical protein IKZ51_06755 [Bacteroidales bacterium]|nr:hypothetical protein [Bacteroidales bacterium]
MKKTRIDHYSAPDSEIIDREAMGCSPLPPDPEALGDICIEDPIPDNNPYFKTLDEMYGETE